MLTLLLYTCSTATAVAGRGKSIRGGIIANAVVLVRGEVAA